MKTRTENIPLEDTRNCEVTGGLSMTVSTSSGGFLLGGGGHYRKRQNNFAGSPIGS